LDSSEQLKGSEATKRNKTWKYMDGSALKWWRTQQPHEKYALAKKLLEIILSNWNAL
jgi:hypothetical protein